MDARALAFNRAAAEENGRQSVSQMRSPLPDGSYRPTEPSHSWMHRLEPIEMPVQTNFSKPNNVSLAWGTQIRADSWNHWKQRLHFSIWPSSHHACNGGGVKDKGNEITALENENKHQLGRARSGSELTMDRGSENTQKLDDEECQKAETFWASIQAGGSPFLYCLLHARRITDAGLYTGEKNREIEGRSGCMRPAWSPLSHPHDEKRYEAHEPIPVSGFGAEDENYQIFIKTPSGKTILVWVSANDTGETLKDKIAQREGYSQIFFYILHGGTVLNEDDRLRECQIDKNSTLQVMYRLRGGSSGNRGTTGPSSYKDAARSKGTQSYKDAARSKGPQTEATSTEQPSPYIVEKLESTLLALQGTSLGL